MDPLGINPDFNRVSSLFEFKVKNLRGEYVTLEPYFGHVCLVVNVASRSALADAHCQLLGELHDKFHARGLRILAFPCNQFNGEEPLEGEQLAGLYAGKGLRYDVFGKVDVNGEAAAPLWKYLKYKLGDDKGRVIRDSFTKYICNRKGAPAERFGPEAPPGDVCRAVESYL